MERLRRYRNTYEVRALIQDLRSHKVVVDIQELRHYMTAPGGFHKGALEKEVGCVATLVALLRCTQLYAIAGCHVCRACVASTCTHVAVHSTPIAAAGAGVAQARALHHTAWPQFLLDGRDSV